MTFIINDERSGKITVSVDMSFDKALEMIGGEECPVHWDRDYDGELLDLLRGQIPIGLWPATITDRGALIGCVVTKQQTDKQQTDTRLFISRWVYCSVANGNSYWYEEK